jgi:hypothetical protein
MDGLYQEGGAKFQGSKFKVNGNDTRASGVLFTLNLEPGTLNLFFTLLARDIRTHCHAPAR